jgi:hypothetical protein
MENFFWINNKTEAKYSPIHGQGRYATQAISTDEVICVAGGFALSKQTSEWKTGLLIDEDFILQPPVDQGYEAFINHSCSPNIYIDGQIVFRALRDISPAEELTIDYGSFMILDRLIIEDCQCDSPNCRKTIHGTDYLKLKTPLSWYGQKKLRKGQSSLR